MNQELWAVREQVMRILRGRLNLQKDQTFTAEVEGCVLSYGNKQPRTWMKKVTKKEGSCVFELTGEYR